MEQHIEITINVNGRPAGSIVSEVMGPHENALAEIDRLITLNRSRNPDLNLDFTVVLNGEPFLPRSPV
jgi:hypothetical protein